VPLNKVLTNIVFIENKTEVPHTVVSFNFTSIYWKNYASCSDFIRGKNTVFDSFPKILV
jgi:hypothetical protein